MEKLEKGGVQIEVKQPEPPNQFAKILLDIAFPCLIIAGLLFFRRMGGMGGDMPGMQSKAKVTVQPETGVKFEDVAGIDEAKDFRTERFSSCLFIFAFIFFCVLLVIFCFLQFHVPCTIIIIIIILSLLLL